MNQKVLLAKHISGNETSSIITQKDVILNADEVIKALGISAEDISFDPTGVPGIGATNLQDAILELATLIDESND